MSEVYDGSGAIVPALPQFTDKESGFARSARVMLENLQVYVRKYEEDYKRVRNLRTFKGRFQMEMSQVQRRDRPEIELYLYHRDAALEMDESITTVRTKLDAIPVTEESAEAIFKAVAKLDRLEDKRLRHVTAMENILETLTKEQIHREQLMAKLAADGAKLVQNASQHEDKMEIARKVVEQPAANDLKARLALKYNVTVDQVDAILSAKSAEFVQHDA